MSQRQRPLTHAFAASCACVLLGAAPVAFAQTEESTESEAVPGAGLEELVITATKREQGIQDVPISVTALDAAMIQDTGLTEFSQIQNFVPNLTILPQTDTRSTSIRIRGIGSVGTNAGIDPSVGVFVDGVYQGRAGMSVQDLLDMERVEVLRGPQGTLYGKNTAAGAINIITKRPSYEYETIAEGVIGNYQNLEFRGALNAPVVEDRLALRVSGYRVLRDGFDINDFTTQRVNDANKYGVRGKLALDVSEALSFQLSGDWAEENNRTFVPDIIRYDINGPSLMGVTFGLLAAAAGEPPPLFADPFDHRVDANVSPRNIIRVGGVALDTLLDWHEHTIRWLNAYRTYVSDSRFDGDFSHYDAAIAFTDVDYDQVSSELTVTSPSWDRFEYQAGLYFLYSMMNTLDRLGWEPGMVRAAQLSPYLFPRLAFGRTAENFNDNDHRTLSLAAYGQGTVQLIEDVLSLTGGLRLTFERKTREGVSLTFPSSPIDAPPVLGPPLLRDEQREVTNLQGMANLQYRPIEDVMIYVGFSNGFKSGGFNQLRTRTGELPEFDDEKSLSYELGVRSTWLDQRLTANVTGYFTDYDDFQSQVFDGSVITVANAGRMFSYGFEAELRYLPHFLDDLIVGSQLALNIAEYDKFFGATNTVAGQQAIVDATFQPAGSRVPAAACGQPAIFPPGCTQDLSGRQVDNAPRWTVMGFFSYEIGVPGYPVLLFTRNDYAYTSEFYLQQDLDPSLLQPGYHLLNLRLGLRAEDELWEIAFWLRNATDTDYLISGFDVPILSGFAGVKGPPRQYGATVRFKF